MNFLLLIGLLPLTLMATEIPKGYNCLRTDSTVVIDGKLDDAAWARAPWTDDFVDIEGDKKPNPRFRTRVKMLWDDKYFYIAAEMEEPHVWATILKRDSVIFRDNDFEVFLDPDGDNHQYGELEINAHNTQWDLFLPKPYKDNGHALDCWNIDGLLSAVHIEGTLNDPSDSDTGWSMEIALPWQALEMCSHGHAAPEPGAYWRVNFSRVEWETDIVDGGYRKVPDRPEANWVWSPQGVINMHRPEMWGYVQFVKDSLHARTLPHTAYQTLAELCHRIYYAQQRYRELYHRWATSLEELDVRVVPGLNATLDMRADGWQAAVSYRDISEYSGILRIRDDSKLWSEPLNLHVRW